MSTTRAILCVSLLSAASIPAQEHEVTDKQAGIAVTLPGRDWKKSDYSTSGVVVHLYSPETPPVPRVALMRFPKVFLAKGMDTRKKQIEGAGAAVKSKRFEKTELGGRSAVIYEYVTAGTRALEYGVEAGDAFKIFQIVATEAEWKDSKTAAAYDGVIKSVRWLDTKVAPKPMKVSKRTPADVRAARKSAAPKEQEFSIVSHDIFLELIPDKGSLSVRDDFVVTGIADRVEELDLTCTHVTVDQIALDGKPLEWRRRNPAKLRVKLPRPLGRGGRVRLRFTAHSDEFRFAHDQKLVQEVAVLGQVSEASCFSSHVFYYPTDQRNDAEVRIAISVPAEYTAVSGGDSLGVERKGDLRVFRYTTTMRTPRALPFGFAAGKFERISAKTPGGLTLELYSPKGKDKEARQRLAVAVESGTLFEKLMGPLPWKRVAICNVQPFRKETGVSLPGLILVSDGFFRNAEGVEISGAALNDPEALGLILIADELSHQWNFYSVPLPNELAEGVSTFTNLLYVEKHAGAAEYRKGLAFCAQTYMAVASQSEDVAVADPALYRSDVYRVVAFCKVPVVIDLLRRRLGDEAFMKAWRDAFTKLRGERGGYAALARELGASSDLDCHAFFEQWFFQAGYPQVRVEWSSAQKEGKWILTLRVEQRQPGGLFDVALDVEADCGAAGKVTPKSLVVGKRVEVFVREVPASVKAIRVRAEGECPLIKVSARRARD